MKRVLKVTTLIILLVLICSCSMNQTRTPAPRIINLTIWNQTTAPIEVMSVYFSESMTINIPAASSRLVKAELYGYNTEITLFVDGRFCKQTEKIYISSSNENIVIRPNISWIAVHNLTESSLRLVGLTEFRNASHNSEYCLWDSFGNSIENSDIAPYQTKYIRIKKDNFDYIKEGYISCWIDKKRYATNKTILVPLAGVEYDVYLYPSELEEIKRF